MDIDEDTSNFLRALIGSATIIGIMVSCVYCLYKYAVCQEEEKRINYINVQSKLSQEV